MELLWPTTTVPKPCRLVSMVRSASLTPVPLMAPTTVPPGLPWTVTVALREPAWVGVKLAVTVQEAPAARVSPEQASSSMAKSVGLLPPRETVSEPELPSPLLVMVNEASPEAVSPRVTSPAKA